MARQSRPSIAKDTSIKKAWLRCPPENMNPFLIEAISSAFRPFGARALGLGSANWPALEGLAVRGFKTWRELHTRILP